MLYQTAAPFTSTLHLGQSSTVREGPARHEERAWGWAVDAFQQNRDAVQRAKTLSVAPPTVMAQTVTPPAPSDTKVQRMYKLKVARQAVMDVHRTTQVGESADFAEDQRKAQLREKEVMPLRPRFYFGAC